MGLSCKFSLKPIHWNMIYINHTQIHCRSTASLLPSVAQAAQGQRQWLIQLLKGSARHGVEVKPRVTYGMTWLPVGWQRDPGFQFMYIYIYIYIYNIICSYYPNSIKISPKNLATDSVYPFTLQRWGSHIPQKKKRTETKKVYKSG